MLDGKAGRDIRSAMPTANSSYYMSEQKNTTGIIPLDVLHPEVLLPGMIHLYVVSVSEMQHDEAELVSYISPDEEARASRFINPVHGQQYRCIRGLLRKLLSHYLNTIPEQIQFSYAEHGKPMLINDPTLYFNLSHSRDMAAFAFSQDHEVGVDIEYMRKQKNLDGMIAHVGSTKEQVELKALNKTEAYAAFYRLWTRKEAFIKACGRGLGMGLRSIHIGTAESSTSLFVDYKNSRMTGWYITDIEPPQGYKLAVCSKYK